MKKGLLIIGACAALITSSRGAILINEVFGGGGNTGAPFNQDYVELFNNGTAAVDLTGLILQYASPTGLFSGTIITIGPSSPTTMLAPLDFYVVTSGPAGSTTTFTPTPNVDATGATSVNLGGVNGKVRLLAADGTTVLDLVGYGTATLFEGLGAAPAATNSTSVSRIADGVDTNNNNVDFATLAPTPGLTNIPEPTAALAMFSGVGILLARRRRASTVA